MVRNAIFKLLAAGCLSLAMSAGATVSAAQGAATAPTALARTAPAAGGHASLAHRARKMGRRCRTTHTIKACVWFTARIGTVGSPPKRDTVLRAWGSISGAPFEVEILKLRVEHKLCLKPKCPIGIPRHSRRAVTGFRKVKEFLRPLSCSNPQTEYRVFMSYRYFLGKPVNNWIKPRPLRGTWVVHIRPCV